MSEEFEDIALIPSPPAFHSGGSNGFAAAVQFLTRVRLPFGSSNSTDSGVAYYGLVGALIGLASAIILAIALALGAPELLAGLLAVAASMLITGALHEDGLADCLDGFGGGQDTATKLNIMRDSRIGTYGVLGLIVSVAVRAVAAAGLAHHGAVYALIATHALSRAALPILGYILPSVRSDGLGAAFQPTRKEMLWAVGSALAIALLCLGFVPACLVGIVLAGVVAIVGWIAQRQIGGYTGDVLGLGEQVSEAAILFSLVAIW